MVSQEFKLCLVDVYQGEVVGEAAFDNMIVSTETAEQKFIIASMLQFETEAKAIMRPVLFRYGLPVNDSENGHQYGVNASTGLNQIAWLDRFEALRGMIAEQFLPRYLELETLISEKDDPQAAQVSAFMAEHERRMLKLAENVVRGVNDPAAPVIEMLRHPLPRTH